MKLFNSLQELYSYAMFCPMCQDMSRKISWSIGPEYSVKLLSDRKEEKYINLSIEIVEDANGKNESVRLHDIVIDGCLNTLTYSTITNTRYKNQLHGPIEFYLSLFGSCLYCESFVNSGECLIKLSSNKIVNFELSDESFVFPDGDTEYYVRYLHDEDKMFIKRYRSSDCRVSDSRKISPVWCPLFDLDFKNKSKALKRIKTILIFS